MELTRRIVSRIPGIIPKFYSVSVNAEVTKNVEASRKFGVSTELKGSVQKVGLNSVNISGSEISSVGTPIIDKTPTIDEADKLYSTVELELRGNDKAVLKSFEKFAVTVGNHFNIESTAWSLRKPHHEKFTVLKSVHIYKKHRVQYEFRTYFSFVQYKKLTGSTAETLLEYIERNLPEGVALKATKVELQPYPEHIK